MVPWLPSLIQTTTPDAGARKLEPVQLARPLPFLLHVAASFPGNTRALWFLVSGPHILVTQAPSKDWDGMQVDVDVCGCVSRWPAAGVILVRLPFDRYLDIK